MPAVLPRIVVFGMIVVGCQAPAPRHVVSAPATTQRSEATELAAQLNNADIKWQGTYMGLMPSISGAPARRLVEVGPPAYPALLIALRDPKKFAAAHVVLTEDQEHGTFSGSGWNGLRVDLMADGRTILYPELRPELERFWRETIASKTPVAPISWAAIAPDTPPKKFFPKQDEQLLERYGVHFVPVGEGPLVRSVPVDSIFLDKESVLTEGGLVDMFPAIQRMDPHRLHLDLSEVSDHNVELFNRLRSADSFDLRDSSVTIAGLRRLRLKPGKELTVPQKISEAERRELHALMPGVTIR